MNGRSEREERRHQRISELIPWYVNGTLSADERRAVDDHSEVCPRCRSEIGANRELALTVRADTEVAPSPHPVQLARLLARIDAYETGADHRGDDMPAISASLRFEESAPTPPARRGLTGPFALTPRRMRRLLVAELAAILVLAAGLAWHLRAEAWSRPTQYRTLSSDPPVAARGTVALRVVFTESATAGRIQALLASVGGQITAGPSPLGAYVVEVRGDAGDAGNTASTGNVGNVGGDPLALVLAHLRGQPEVSFVEPVAGEGR